MNLPENVRREAESVTKRKLWIYGQPFSGKTTIADRFPDPLMINSDGNVKYVTAPYVLITDRVETSGRMSRTTLAWEVFKETVEELAKKQNTFKTIVVDLLEDMYDHCRKYVYAQLGISHESDGGYGKGWDMVKTEFLSTIKKLVNLDYENIILISQETTSEDITKRSGDRITAIKPNIPDKTALKVAGMVDVVMRAVVIDGEYKLTFKTDEVEFGGGRIRLEGKEIPNDYDALMTLLTETEKRVPKKREMTKTETSTEEPKRTEEPKTETVASVEDVPVQEEPKTEGRKPRRTRRTRNEEEA